MRPQGWKLGIRGRELEGKIGLDSGHFRAVQIHNLEVGRVRNSLGTDLGGPEQGFTVSHKKTLAAILGSTDSADVLG